MIQYLSMKKPLISVLIPAYNEENYLEPCLKSVLRQSLSPKLYEIVVIDNNSTDRTAEIVRKYSPRVKLVREKKQGVVFARIRGVEKSRGEIIAFTDADCLAPKNWLSKKLQQFQENPQIVGVGGPFLFPSPSPLGKMVEKISFYSYPFLKVIPCANLSFKKKAYFQCGGFNPKINIAEEADLSLKLQKIGVVVNDKHNPIWTSPRRLLSSNQIIFGLKYLYCYFLLRAFGKPVFFHFKPIRDRGFLKNHFPVKKSFAPALGFSFLAVMIIIFVLFALSRPKVSQALLNKKSSSKTEEFLRRKITSLEESSQKINSKIQKYLPKDRLDRPSFFQK